MSIQSQRFFPAPPPPPPLSNVNYSVFWPLPPQPPSRRKNVIPPFHRDCHSLSYHIFFGVICWFLCIIVLIAEVVMWPKRRWGGGSLQHETTCKWNFGRLKDFYIVKIVSCCRCCSCCLPATIYITPHLVF